MGRRGRFVTSVRASGTAIGDRVTRRLPAALVLGVGALALAGCAQADRPQSTMDPKGDYAQKIFNLSWPVFLIAGVVGVIVFVTIAVAIVRFRERPRLSPSIPELGPMRTSDAAVYMSRLRPTGAQYEVVESVPLGGG